MRKRTLVALECEKVGLELEIEDLTTVINKAQSLSKASMYIPSRVKVKCRIAVVKVDVTWVSMEVKK